MDQSASPLVLKIRYLLVPVVALSILGGCGYTLLNWLLVVRSDWIPVNDEVVDLWVPLTLSWLGVVILIQSPLRLIKKDKKEFLPTLYTLVSVAAVAVPTLVAQSYIRVATGTLTPLATAGEIARRPATKYYAVASPCLVLTQQRSKAVVSVTGKSRDTLNFDDYFVVPACDPASVNAPLPVWVAFKFHEQHSSNLPRDRVDALYAAFLRRSESQLYDENPAAFRYFERLGRTADRKGYLAALGEANVDANTVLLGHEGPFEGRMGSRLTWIFGSFGICVAVLLLIVLSRPLNEEALAGWLANRKRRIAQGRRSRANRQADAGMA